MTEPAIPRTERQRGSRWQRIRARILRRHPICQSCHVRFSTRIEHLWALQFGGGNEPDNLAAYCERCARAKDRREARIASELGLRRRPKFRGWGNGNDGNGENAK